MVNNINNETARINNNMISYINKSSRDEFNRIVEFSLRIIIKDEKEAEEEETIEISREAYEYIDAILELDNKTEEDRLKVIKNYKEKNSYYINLYDKYGIEYVKSRQAKDGDILWYPDTILDNKEISIYMELYYSSYLYVTRVFKTKAFENQPLYNNFLRFLVVFITLNRFISYRMENASDIEYYNEYTLKNMLIGFKLEEFAQLSTAYQKRILQNVNSFIRNKGTDVVIVDILKLFGFDNIQVFKYYLLRDYPDVSSGGKVWTKPYLKFIKVPIGDLNYEKTFNEYTPIDFKSMTDNDPYWTATEEELLAEDFNFVQTKYLSIETTMSFMKETLKLSYIINLLFHIQEKHPNENNLYVSNKKISSSPMRLVDILIALQALVIRRNGFVDRTCTDINSIRTVYDYQLGKEVEIDYRDKKVYSFNFETFTEPQEVTITMNPADLTAYYGQLCTWDYSDLRQKVYFSLTDLNDYTLVYQGHKHTFIPYKFSELKNINTHLTTALEVDASHINNPDDKEFSGKIDISEFTTMFDINTKMRDSLKKEVLACNNYEAYRQLRHLYDIKFTSNIVNSIFTGYKTYCDYLKDYSPSLYQYVQDIIDVMSLDEGLVEKDFYKEAILNLSDIIDSYLGEYFDNTFLQNNSIVGDYIKEYLYRMLSIFKAYTVDINQINVIYQIDDPLMNTIKLIDGGIIKGYIRREEVIKLSTRFDQMNLMDFYDTINLKSKYNQLNSQLYEDYVEIYDLEKNTPFNNKNYLTDLILLDDKDEYLWGNLPVLSYNTYLDDLKDDYIPTTYMIPKEEIKLVGKVVFKWLKPTLSYSDILEVEEYPLFKSMFPNKEHIKLYEGDIILNTSRRRIEESITKYFNEKHVKDKKYYICDCFGTIEDIHEIKQFILKQRNSINLKDTFNIIRLDENGNVLDK